MIIPVTYSAQWYRVPLTYKDRYSVYSSGILSNTKTPLEKHWFSILNSMVLVIILAAVVAFILYKVLKKDLQKYNDRENPVSTNLNDLTHPVKDFGEGDYGWKEIRNDVFRLPQQVNLLSAFTGVGVQFIVVGALVLLANVLDLVSLGGDGKLRRVTGLGDIMNIRNLTLRRPTYCLSCGHLRCNLLRFWICFGLLVQKTRR